MLGLNILILSSDETLILDTTILGLVAFLILIFFKNESFMKQSKLVTGRVRPSHFDLGNMLKKGDRVLSAIILLRMNNRQWPGKIQLDAIVGLCSNQKMGMAWVIGFR